MTTGQIVKTKREIEGLTQRELAEKIGVHPSYIGQIERNTKTLSLGTASLIAKYFKCSVLDLLPDQNIEGTPQC